MNRKMPVPKVDIPKINMNETMKVSFDEKSEVKGKRIEQWTFINHNVLKYNWKLFFCDVYFS